MAVQRRQSLNSHLRECGIRDDLRYLINDIAKAGKRIHFTIRTSDPKVTDLINASVEPQLTLTCAAIASRRRSWLKTGSSTLLLRKKKGDLSD